MIIASLLHEMNEQLFLLRQINFGYPIGENAVLEPLPAAEAARLLARLDGRHQASLREFYAHCNGVSLPDVHNGYFIKPLAKVVAFDLSSEPNRIISDREISVLPIGSTGGGSLFVLELDAGQVLLLPPGPLCEGRYDATSTAFRTAAQSFEEFLALIVDDVRAFVADDRQHEYLGNARSVTRPIVD